mmetsp:Transcript_10372/g.29576  ORF Transcript_10372/g.29576 Transcript_10372/m.29576 type:complete len:434 (+) Transcript_10372:3294-4595(+)
MVAASGAAVGIIANQPSPEMGFSLRIVVPTAATQMEVAPLQQPSTFHVLNAVAEIAHRIVLSQYHNKQETLPTKCGQRRGEAIIAICFFSRTAKWRILARLSIEDHKPDDNKQRGGPVTLLLLNHAGHNPRHRLPPFVTAEQDEEQSGMAQPTRSQPPRTLETGKPGKDAASTHSDHHTAHFFSLATNNNHRRYHETRARKCNAATRGRISKIETEFFKNQEQIKLRTQFLTMHHSRSASIASHRSYRQAGTPNQHNIQYRSFLILQNQVRNRIQNRKMHFFASSPLRRDWFLLEPDRESLAFGPAKMASRMLKVAGRRWKTMHLRDDAVVFSIGSCSSFSMVSAVSRKVTSREILDSDWLVVDSCDTFVGHCALCTLNAQNPFRTTECLWFGRGRPPNSPSNSCRSNDGNNSTPKSKACQVAMTVDAQNNHL